MSKLQNEVNKIISEVENNLSNEKDVKYVKDQICNIYNLFIEEFDSLEERTTKKIDNILIKYKTLEDKVNLVENTMNKIKEDIYVPENENYDFTIKCPYCDTEFEVDSSDDTINSIICPECNHIIELDWNEEDDGCSGDCHNCGGDCSHNDDDM